MSDERKRSFGESFHTWVQTIGIIIAAGWGVYTFIYKEIKAPKSAPTNISMNMELKKVSTNSVGKPLIPIEIRISATNPSPRTVYLLTSCWTALGTQIAQASKESDSFIGDAINDMNAQGGKYINRHADISTWSIIAAGGLFKKNGQLRPNETIATTIIFYVPRKGYNFVEVRASMPSVEKRNGITLEWQINGETKILNSILTLTYPNGKNRQLKLDDKRDLNILMRLGYQRADSSSHLSLWE